MIVKRTVTLWHVTKTEYVPSILKNGLQAKYAIEHKDSASMRSGLSENEIKGKIYLSRSLDYLPMELKPGKTLLRIDIPKTEYDKLVDVGDPLFKRFKTTEEYKKFWIKTLRKTNPDFFKTHTIEQVNERFKDFDIKKYTEGTMVIEKDIPASWIKVEKSK